MKIKPAGPRIVVIPDKLEDKDDRYAAARRAGIEIVHSERLREQGAVDTGTVESIGSTAYLAYDNGAPWCTVGDKVAYAKYAGKYIGEDEDRRLVLNDDDIIAVLENVDE